MGILLNSVVFCSCNVDKPYTQWILVLGLGLYSYIRLYLILLLSYQSVAEAVLPWKSDDNTFYDI